MKNTIGFQFQEVQNPFTLIFTPENISTAEDQGLGDIISSIAIDSDARATAGKILLSYIFIDNYLSFCYIGADFNQTTFVHNVSASSTTTNLGPFLEVINDTTNEREQSFAVIARIGDEVPDRFCCFQTQVGATTCIGDGRSGVARMRIEDDDRKYK